MNTDPAETDVSSLVQDMRNDRYDSFSATRLAMQIDLVRSGTGTGPIDDAVDELQRVAATLEQTDEALHAKLSELGASWQGTGSQQGLVEFDEQAGFAADMADTLRTVSQVLFEQGDAFNRARAQLPEAEAVRKAAGGLDVGDTMASALGFETDHTAEVIAGSEAREHAIQVFNEYVDSSSNGLGSLLDRITPQVPTYRVATGDSGGDDAAVTDRGRGDSAGPDTFMGADSATAATPTIPGTPADTGLAGTGIGNVGAVTSGSVDAGSAAYSGAGGTVHSGAEPSGGTGSGATVSSATTSAGAGSARVFDGGTSPGATPSTTAPTGGGYATGGSPVDGSAAGGRHGFGSPVAEPGYGQAGSAPSDGGQRVPGRSGPPIAGEQAAPGRAVGRVTVSSPGGGHGQPSLPVGKPYQGMSPVDSAAGTPQSPLAKGSMSGVGPQASAAGAPAGAGYVPSSGGGPRATDIGAGAAAVGAGGAAGGMSNAEPQGRGVGRSAPNAGSPGRAMPFDAAPGEDTADAVRRVDGDSLRQREAGVLQRATAEDDDAEHVRSFAVDHADLFSDDRLVSPERIATGEVDEFDSEN